jgi:hypothetical protein
MYRAISAIIFTTVSAKALCNIETNNVPSNASTTNKSNSNDQTEIHLKYESRKTSARGAHNHATSHIAREYDIKQDSSCIQQSISSIATSVTKLNNTRKAQDAGNASDTMIRIELSKEVKQARPRAVSNPTHYNVNILNSIAPRESHLTRHTRPKPLSARPPLAGVWCLSLSHAYVNIGGKRYLPPLSTYLTDTYDVGNLPSPSGTSGAGGIDASDGTHGAGGIDGPIGAYGVGGPYAIKM